MYTAADHAFDAEQQGRCPLCGRQPSVCGHCRECGNQGGHVLGCWNGPNPAHYVEPQQPVRR